MHFSMVPHNLLVFPIPVTDACGAASGMERGNEALSSFKQGKVHHVCQGYHPPLYRLILAPWLMSYFPNFNTIHGCVAG
jgi:hypothetical protein